MFLRWLFFFLFPGCSHLYFFEVNHVSSDLSCILSLLTGFRHSSLIHPFPYTVLLCIIPVKFAPSTCLPRKYITPIFFRLATMHCLLFWKWRHSQTVFFTLVFSGGLWSAVSKLQTFQNVSETSPSYFRDYTSSFPGDFFALLMWERIIHAHPSPPSCEGLEIQPPNIPPQKKLL